ncbi:MAG: NAD(P)H-dependent oxidoreductase [Victivallaceae bacterium]
MKILLVNGSPRRNGNSSTALAAVEKGIAANLTAEVESSKWRRV